MKCLHEKDTTHASHDALLMALLKHGKIGKFSESFHSAAVEVFLASCACGPHPIRDAPYEEGAQIHPLFNITSKATSYGEITWLPMSGPFVVRETKAPWAQPRNIVA